MISVPTVDIGPALAGEPGAVAEAARALDEACTTSGFFVITGHGVPPELVEDVMAQGRRFFRLPFEDKQRVAPPGPEQVESLDYLKRLARVRGDDLVSGGTVVLGDVAAAMSEAADEETED